MSGNPWSPRYGIGSRSSNDGYRRYDIRRDDLDDDYFTESRRSGRRSSIVRAFTGWDSNDDDFFDHPLSTSSFFHTRSGGPSRNSGQGFPEHYHSSRGEPDSDDYEGSSPVPTARSTRSNGGGHSSSYTFHGPSGDMSYTSSYGVNGRGHSHSRSVQYDDPNHTYSTSRTGHFDDFQYEQPTLRRHGSLNSDYKVRMDDPSHRYGDLGKERHGSSRYCTPSPPRYQPSDRDYYGRSSIPRRTEYNVRMDDPSHTFGDLGSQRHASSHRPSPPPHSRTAPQGSDYNVRMDDLHHTYGDFPRSYRGGSSRHRSPPPHRHNYGRRPRHQSSRTHSGFKGSQYRTRTAKPSSSTPPPKNFGTRPEIDLYTVLGVSKTASQDELKKAHRKMSMRHHPDRVSVEQKDTATKKMAQINQAFGVLADEEQRREYDATGMIPSSC